MKRPLSLAGDTVVSSVGDRSLHKLVNVCDAAVAAVEALAEQVKRGKVDGQLGDVEALLHSLPLGSGDFCRVSNNLKNAQRYLQSQEWGAASYELKMLAGAVRSCLHSSRIAEAWTHGRT